MDEPLRVGIEVEFRGVDRSNLQTLMRRLGGNRFGIELHDDGSIRFPTYRIANTPFLAHHVRGRALIPPGTEEMGAYGPEIVTGVLDRQKAIECCHFLADLLYKIPETDTASIHVHVSGFDNWKHIHNLLLWFCHLEAPLYRVAGLGRQHRGERNDYRFCRPLSNPISLRSGRSLVPLIDYEKLMGAKSFSEMLYAWGRMDYYWGEGIGHYCPHRLHGINIVPLTRLGTVEFRIFNGVYRYLLDALMVSLAVYDIARRGAPKADQPIFELGSQPNISVAEFSEILGIPIASAVWGKRWPAPPMSSQLLSHYNSHNESLPSEVLMRSVNWRV